MENTATLARGLFLQRLMLYPKKVVSNASFTDSIIRAFHTNKKKSDFKFKAKPSSAKKIAVAFFSGDRYARPSFRRRLLLTAVLFSIPSRTQISIIAFRHVTAKYSSRRSHRAFCSTAQVRSSSGGLRGGLQAYRRSFYAISTESL